MALAISGLFFTSCGSSEICQCVETELAYYKESTELDNQHRETLSKKFSGKKEFTDSETKEIKELNEKHNEKSSEISEKFNEKRKSQKCLSKGKSTKEIEKWYEEFKKCSAYEELQKYNN